MKAKPSTISGGFAYWAAAWKWVALFSAMMGVVMLAFNVVRTARPVIVQTEPALLPAYQTVRSANEFC